jgi:glyoxylase-like metal-dependent hydrolase (beta-lactamase superfamily II)
LFVVRRPGKIAGIFKLGLFRRRGERKSLPNRRDILTSITGAVWAAAAARLVLAARLPEIAASDLADGLVAFAGAGANVVALFGSTGTLLVDGGSADRSKDLLALVAERGGGKPVETLFNTSWRDEHTGSNEALGTAGARILAHENTKLWLGADFFVDWEDRHYGPHPAAALPNKTFYTSGSIDFGGRKIEYLHLPRAHTDGDVAVLFRDQNVVAAGGLVAVGAYPIVDYATGGWIGGLEAATRALLDATDKSTRIVPAFGPVCGRPELEAQLALATAVRERVADAYRKGLSFDEFVATKPTKEFDAQRGDPARFLMLVHKGAWAHIRELGGVI